IAMLNCFVTSLAPSLQKKVTIDPIEQTLLESEPNKQSIYTYDVLSALEARYKEDNTSAELYFIIGPDNAAPEIWQKVYQHDEITKRWQLFVVEENLKVHSTQARALFSNPVINKTELHKLLFENVANYIQNHQLYQSDTPVNLSIDMVVFGYFNQTLHVLL